MLVVGQEAAALTGAGAVFVTHVGVEASVVPGVDAVGKVGAVTKSPTLTRTLAIFVGTGAA